MEQNNKKEIKKIKEIIKQLLEIRKKLLKLGWYKGSPLTNNIEEIIKPLKFVLDDLAFKDYLEE